MNSPATQSPPHPIPLAPIGRGGSMTRSRFRPGPVIYPSGPLLVSITDFRSDTFRDLPAIVAAGMRLRRHWPDLEGAVGVWLWTVPAARRTGSVAVWTDREAMRRFVRLPDHVAIVRTYRRRGTVRSDTWAADAFDTSAIWRESARWLRQG